jgi:hypothetical protein
MIREIRGVADAWERNERQRIERMSTLKNTPSDDRKSNPSRDVARSR